MTIKKAAHGGLLPFSDIYSIYLKENLVNFYSQDTLPPGDALINNLKMGWLDGKIERIVSRRMVETQLAGRKPSI